MSILHQKPAGGFVRLSTIWFDLETISDYQARMMAQRARLIEQVKADE